MCVCLSVHWLYAGDDQTGGAMVWRFGILTGTDDHAKPWRGKSVADCQV